MSRTNLLGYDRVNPIDLVTTDPSAPRPASEQSESVGFLGAFPAGWRENFLSEAAHAAIAPAFPVDPNWSPKRTDIDAVTEGIDEDLWYKYEKAVSADHLYSLYVDNLAKMDRRRTMQQAGWSGVFARVVAELPEQAIIGALSGGLGSAVAATRAARMVNYAKAGLLAGVPAVGMEAFRASVNPDIRNSDVALAGLSAFGGTVGGAIGSRAGGGFLRVGAGVGIGSALPFPAVGSMTGMDRNEIILGSSAALLFGGTFGGLGGMMEARLRPAQPDPKMKQMAEAAMREIHDRATVIDAILGVLDRKPKPATGLMDKPLVSMTYMQLDDITSPRGFATLKDYYTAPPDPRAALARGRLAEFGPTIAPGDSADARVFADIEDAPGFQREAQARYSQFGEVLDPTFAERSAAANRLAEFGGTLNVPDASPTPLRFSPITPPDAPQVTRRQTAIDGLGKLDAQEQARIDALDRLFPGAAELQEQAIAASAERVANKRAVTDGRRVDIVDADDIDPLFADTLGLTVDELKATLEANFTRKFAKEFGYTFSRKRMEAKRAGVLEMVEALDDDLPPGVKVLKAEDIVGRPEFKPTEPPSVTVAKRLRGDKLSDTLSDFNLASIYGDAAPIVNAAVKAIGRQLADDVKPSEYVFRALAADRLVNGTLSDEAAASLKLTKEFIDGLAKAKNKASAVYKELKVKKSDVEKIVEAVDAIAKTEQKIVPAIPGAVFDARLTAATDALADAANPPAPAMGAASANDPAFTGDPGTTTPLPNLEAGMFLVHTIGDEVPWGADIRKWTTARAMNVVASASKNPIARIAANVLGFDFARVNARTGELVGAKTAGIKWAEYHSAGMDNVYQSRRINAFEIHKKQGGQLSEAEFNEAIAKAKRRYGTPKYAEYENIPGIKEGVEAYTKAANEPSAAVMFKHGIEGADTTAKENYVLREWIQWKMMEAEKKIGNAELLKALAQAYSNANPNDPPEIAALVARYIRKNGGSHEYRHPGLDMLDGELEVVLKTMTDQGEKEALVKLFRERVEARRATKGTPTALRTRIDLDETYVHKVTRGGETIEVAIEDLLENDIAALGKKQIRRAHGSVVHKELMRRLSKENGVQLKTFDDLKAYLQYTGKQQGQTSTQIEWEIARIEHMYRMAVGIPRVTDPKYHYLVRAGRMARSALRSTLLSTHYYTMTNMGEPVSHLVTDISTAAKSLVPAVSELTDRIADGTLSNKNARMFEFMTGRGASWISERTHVMETPISGIDAVLGKLENTVASIGRFGSRLTLAQQTQDYFYRTMGDEMQARIGEWILSGKKPNAALLREFGWTDAQWNKIAEAGRPHVESITGSNGRKYLVLNQDKWSAEAFSTLEAGIWSALDAGFTNPTGEARSWLSNNELGRFIFQFRDFVLFSGDAKWGRAAFSFMEGDKAVAAARLASRFAANAIYSYVLYTMAVYLKSLGRPDAEEYREERLGNGKAWMMAIGRTSYSSVIPMVVDGSLAAVDVDPVFAPGRASGIQGGGLGSIPVMDFANRSIPAMGKLIRRPFVEDEDISVQDVMAATRGIPFFFQYEPLTKGVEYLARNVLKLPEKPKE